ncbi:MAG: protein tyrosine phosphatase [Proteobacteria bacterium]|nr:protein tyrosine phosphatase [Pseudomonadota bacterium]
MTKIIVCPLAHVEETVREHRPDRILTLLNPRDCSVYGSDWTMVDAYVEALKAEDLSPEEHLQIGVYDITEPAEGQTVPDETHVRQVLDFARRWDGEQTVLVHCFAGISRSTASAFILACEKNPHVEEREIAKRIRERSPTAFPNPLIVSIADEMMGRRGRMADAVNAMGLSQPGKAAPFHIEARW